MWSPKRRGALAAAAFLFALGGDARGDASVPGAPSTKKPADASAAKSPDARRCERLAPLSDEDEPTDTVGPVRLDGPYAALDCLCLRHVRDYQLCNTRPERIVTRLSHPSAPFEEVVIVAVVSDELVETFGHVMLTADLAGGPYDFMLAVRTRAGWFFQAIGAHPFGHNETKTASVEVASLLPGRGKQLLVRLDENSRNPKSEVSRVRSLALCGASARGSVSCTSPIPERIDGGTLHAPVRFRIEGVDTKHIRVSAPPGFKEADLGDYLHDLVGTHLVEWK